MLHFCNESNWRLSLNKCPVLSQAPTERSRNFGEMVLGYTLYEGLEVTGRARAVFVNGVLTAEYGESVREGAGRYVPRATLPASSSER